VSLLRLPYRPPPVATVDSDCPQDASLEEVDYTSPRIFYGPLRLRRQAPRPSPGFPSPIFRSARSRNCASDTRQLSWLPNRQSARTLRTPRRIAAPAWKVSAPIRACQVLGCPPARTSAADRSSDVVSRSAPRSAPPPPGDEQRCRQSIHVSVSRIRSTLVVSATERSLRCNHRECCRYAMQHRPLGPRARSHR